MKLKDAIALEIKDLIYVSRSVRAHAHRLQHFIRYGAIIVGAAIWLLWPLIVTWLSITTYSMVITNPLVWLASAFSFLWYLFWFGVYLDMFDSWLDSKEAEYARVGA